MGFRELRQMPEEKTNNRRYYLQSFDCTTSFQYAAAVNGLTSEMESGDSQLVCIAVQLYHILHHGALGNEQLSR